MLRELVIPLRHLRTTSVVGALVAVAVGVPLGLAAPAVAQVVEPEGVEAAADVVEQPLDVDPEGEALPDALEEPEAQPGMPEQPAPLVAEEAGPGDTELVALSGPVPVEARELAVVGVTWAGAPDGVTVAVRHSVAGEWTAWETVDVDADPAAAGEEGPDVRGGSDPAVVVGADEVQVRIAVPAGAGEVVDPQLFVYAADATAADAQVVPAATLPSADAVARGALLRTDGTPGLASDAEVMGAGWSAPPATDASLVSDVVGALDAAPGGAGGPGAELTAVPTSTAAPAVAGYPAGTRLSAPRPSINPRSAWGAAAPKNGLGTATIQGTVVHHTAGSNDYTKAQVPALIRGIQSYHMSGRGWSDIGYNFLVDKYGGIWEGRYRSLTHPTEGVHAAGYNTRTFGISVMGNYVGKNPEQAVLDALARTIAWKLSEAGVLADGKLGTTGLSAIIGHKDVAATACPGRIYDHLAWLRRTARSYQKVVTPTLPRTIVDRDLDGDGLNEVLTWTSSGVRATQASELPVASGTSVGTNWTIIDAAATTPARDDRTVGEVIARETATGRLYAYQGTGSGGFMRGRTLIGTGWHAMRLIATPGDWNRDGVDDLLAVRKSDGALLLYAGRGGHKYRSPVQVGRGWQRIVSVVGAGDVTGDGHPDLVALRDDRAILAYPNDGKGGFRSAKTLGTAHVATDLLVYAGDLNGDGHGDVLLRGKDGRMTTWWGRAGTKLERGTTWGSQWDRVFPIMSADNWTGRGSAAVLAASSITGKMYRYDGHQGGALATSSRSLPIPTRDVDALFVVGDVRGDGTADVVTRTKDGNLHLHETTASGTWRSGRQVGRAWGVFDWLGPAGDVDGDGVPDVLARDTTGVLWVYPMKRDGSFGSRFTIGHGFGGYTLAPVGGWTSSSSADVVAVRESTGRAYLYRGNGTAGLSSGVEVASGLKGAELLGVGDFRHSGNNDLLVRDTSGRLWLHGATGGPEVGPRTAVGGTIGKGDLS